MLKLSKNSTWTSQQRTAEQDKHKAHGNPPPLPSHTHTHSLTHSQTRKKHQKTTTRRHKNWNTGHSTAKHVTRRHPRRNQQRRGRHETTEKETANDDTGETYGDSETHRKAIGILALPSGGVVQRSGGPCPAAWCPGARPGAQRPGAWRFLPSSEYLTDGQPHQ